MASASEIDDLLRLLVETPRRLEAGSRGLDDERLQRPPGEGAWSANEIRHTCERARTSGVAVSGDDRARPADVAVRLAA